MSPRASFMLKVSAIALLVLGAGGCNTLQRLSEVGDVPRTSRIEDPTQQSGYQQISMPMPEPISSPPAGVNSLWRPGSRSFFKDLRANNIGDILTVNVIITDSGQLSNATSTSRGSSEEADSDFTLLGLESKITQLFSKASPVNLFDFGTSGRMNGTGTANRKETVRVNLAAQVVQKMPNGNLVISGRQELRVNGELRELNIQGIIRPEDITSANTISSEKIAEARIVYGGRGLITDVQQPRYGQQIFDILAPF
ncbi:flagellar L-ring protein 1 [Alphaproteobacteria bacterium]|nr:flagellar L-ring protein 1 [Alphaproteobacteria bacterium]